MFYFELPEAIDIDTHWPIVQIVYRDDFDTSATIEIIQCFINNTNNLLTLCLKANQKSGNYVFNVFFVKRVDTYLQQVEE